MKKSKSKLALMMLTLGALTMAGCGETTGETGGDDEHHKHEWGAYVVETAATELLEGKEVKTCITCGKTSDRSIPALGFERTIVFKDANGTVIDTQKVRSVNKITKPADPTAPEGQVFYGWKNVKNGGQIWDFDDDVLGLAAYDAELVPVFVPANMKAQYLEGELVGDIVRHLNAAGDKEIGWHGATYSGGADGAQLIYVDEDKELGSSCEIDPVKCYRNPTNQEWVVGDAPDGVDQLTFNPKADNMGSFVHFNYTKGNKFVWNITSDKAVTDATIFMRIGAEYGVQDSATNKTTTTFTDAQFPLKVNGTKLDYGTITMTNIPDIGKFLPMQDYIVGVNVALNEGANEITLEVANDDSIMGTIEATSPCFDCLKIYTSANITWNEADPVGLLRKGILL